MDRIKLNIVGIVIISTVICACKNNDNLFLIGEDLVNANTLLAEVDTFTVKLFTIKLDSLETSGTGRLLIGKYNDGQFVNVSSKGIFSIGLPEESNISTSDVYDSIILILTYSGYSHGDTSISQQISVHALEEKIKAFDDGYIYNTTKFKYNPIPIGSTTIIPKPKKGGKVTIRLNDELGEEIFSFFQNKSNEVSDDDRFVNYLPGFALLADTSHSSSLIGYKASDSSLMMRLYFHRPGETATTIEYDFPLIYPETQYNQISSNLINATLSLIKSQRDKISSDECSDESYMQAGSGIMTRIEIPYLGTLLEFDRKVEIISAKLILEPLRNSYDFIGLPDNLILYETDRINRIEGIILDDQSEYQYATLYYDELYKENTYYTFDITDFLRNELSGNYYDADHALLLSLPSDSYLATFNRLILSGQAKSHSKTKLKINYLFYD
jgi:hypothetical protein